MTTLTIQLELSDESLLRLRQEAEQRNITLDELVRERLETSLDEPSDGEILATIRESMQDALAGNVRPVDDVIAELEAEFDFDADES